MRIGKKFSALFLLTALALTGCTGTAEPTQSASQTPTEEPTPEPVYLTAPLTGVQYLEGTNPYLGLAAISGKIDNTFNGRPQLALNDADIVYVTRVEGGMTRLVPVWHSQMPETIGPVRSVRPVDASIIDQYDGIFVYSGGQAPFKKAARETGLVMSDEDTENDKDTYFREPSRSAPWNLFFRAQKLQSIYVEQPAPTQSLVFDAIPTAVAVGEKVESIDVKYTSLRSTWKPGTGTYPWSTASQTVWLRWMDKTEHLQEGGAQVMAKNVIVMEVEHDLSFIDPKYGAIPKAKINDNTGVAHIFSDGFYIKAIWTKGGNDQPIRYTLETGEAVKLAIGNTWVEMMDLPKAKLTITKPQVATESDQ